MVLVYLVSNKKVPSKKFVSNKKFSLSITSSNVNSIKGHYGWHGNAFRQVLWGGGGRGRGIE